MNRATLAFRTLAAIALLAYNATAQPLQAGQVPAAVQQSFKAKFPGAKAAEWKIKPDKHYEAEFTLNGTEIAAKFDAAGKWLETESAIPRIKVPQPVNGAIAKAFQSYKVIETQSLRPWDSTDLIYEIHLENTKEVVKAQFAANGKLLNQSAKPKSAK